MLVNNKKYIYFCKNIGILYNIYLILDKNYFDYIYNLNLLNNVNKNIYIYILNNIYIFLSKDKVYYLLFKMYKYIFNNFINIKKFKLIINVIGVNYKFYFLNKYNLLIFQLKYSHKIILKLSNSISCNVNKNLVYLYSENLFILNTIGKLINSFQFINKYKELGLNIVEKDYDYYTKK